MASPAYLLVGRPHNAVLFRTKSGAITARDFLALAHRLAADIPAAAAVINLAQDRCLFAAIFAASVLRGSLCILASERSPAHIQRIMAGYPDAIAVADSALPGLTCHIVSHHAGQTATPANPLIPATRQAAVVFTSGSTGHPVEHQKNWGAMTERTIAAGYQFNLCEDNPADILGTVPPQHMYGFETTILQPLHSACATVCGDAFFPADIRDRLTEANSPRILVTTPLQIRALLQADLQLPSLRAVISATAPLEKTLAHSAEEKWHTQVLEIFGATELGSIASRRTITDDSWRLYPQLSLITQDDGTTLLHAPHTTPHPLADFVEVLENGAFRLLGRRTDTVKLAGRRASLAGLNQILNAIDGVEDGVFVPPTAQDVATPHARMLAFVVAPTLSADSILAKLRERVDPVFLPRRVITLSALPRNAVGKLPRQALDELTRQAE